MDELRVMALMRVIEKIIRRHHEGLIRLDEPTFELYELAKRAFYTKDRDGITSVAEAIGKFKK